MAFRTGAYIAALADRLYDNSQLLESWTYVVPGVGEAEATSILREFHRVNVREHRLYYCLNFANNRSSGHSASQPSLYKCNYSEQHRY